VVPGTLARARARQDEPTTTAPRGGDPMSASQAYWQATLQAVTPTIAAWLDQLVAEFGEDAVVEAIRAEAARGNHRKLLGRVQERLATKRASQPPPITFLSGRDVLAILRGERQPPEGRWCWDSRDLSGAEYDEVLRWRANR